MATRAHSQRGAALLVVMVAVAVLTTLAVDLAYDTRVSLRIAANARDELQATYLAKSGVALSRLVLSFQQEIDGAVPSLPNMPSPPRPQIWRLVPVDSDLAGAFFGGGPRAREAAPHGAETGASPDGPAPGRFEVVLDDEGRKVNVQLEALGTGSLGAQVQGLYQLVCDPRWDSLFDREDEHGQRTSRQDLLVYLRDWVDGDETTSALAASFPPGGCVMVTRGDPFEPGFGDENYPYDRGEDRYRAKNARMDSLAELYLVAGVSDALMAAFGDAMTVYLPRDGEGAKRNVNETDPVRMLENAAIIADPQNQPGLYDPEVARRLHALVTERTYGGILSISPVEFGTLVETAGITVDMNRLGPTSTNNPFTDRSSVFRVRAQGRAGDVAKTLDAVVRFDKPVPGQQVTTPGRLVHWREE
jgi:general secretion pathway protein K